MQETMSQKLASYGQWTYRGAWALEIAASIIGLATGLALGFQAFSANETANAMDLTLASAPFFMVAIAELTKIPIATLLFGVSWLWKPLVLAFLLVLAGITFETVFMGLERAGTLRQLQYETLVGKIDVLNRELANLTASDEVAANSDQVGEAAAEYEKTTALADRALEAIRIQISALDKKVQETAALTPEAARIRDQVRELEELRASRLDERDREAKEAVDQFERQRDSFVARIESARKSGDIDSARRFEGELGKLANPRPKIFANYEKELAPLKEELDRLRAEFARLRASSPAVTDEQRALLERRKKLEESLDSTSGSWDRRIDAASKRLEEALATAETEAKKLSGNQDRRDEIAKEISTLEKERIPMARTDQVRRIAGRWYGKRPEEVTEPEAGVVSVVWFGSLALIAALAGPITAMVALGLQRIAAQSDSHYEGRLSRLVRRMLVRWRWRRVRTVEVRVEVPVDREVEKRINVPVEVEKIIKEILYVPLLTDDPEALRRALAQELPPQVANLVKLSAKTATHRPDEPDVGISKAFEDELQLDFEEPMKAPQKRGGKRARPT
jgi:hypothetical protein